MGSRNRNRRRFRDRRWRTVKRNQKKFMAYTSLALCAMLAMNPLPAYAAAEYASYEQYRSGEAVSDRPHEYISVSISTEEELAEFAENCRLDSWSRDKSVKLENDIVLSRYTNLMIPSFGGIFDGDGHEISGLALTEAGSAVGLFRYIQAGASVSNLSVSGSVAPDGTGSRVGLLVGVNYGRIQNCSVSGRVNGDSEIGGLAGVNGETGEIRKSQSAAMVIGNHFTGGICGRNLGILNNCTNIGSINTYSTEVSYGLEDITVESLEEWNSASNVAAHTDSGGITGYSEGKIYYCTNSGTVGYQHVGYNTGGIVGRLHQGYVQNCTNTGHVLGRKDVGGIAGQMEPFLQIQYLGSKLDDIDREADKFIELLDVTHQDLSHYGKEATSLAESITAGLGDMSGAAGNLLGATNDLWYIYNQELTGISDDLKRLNTDLKNQSDSDKANGNTHNITVSGNELIKTVEDVKTGGDGTADSQGAGGSADQEDSFGESAGERQGAGLEGASGENPEGEHGDASGESSEDKLKDSLGDKLDEELGDKLNGNLGDKLDGILDGSGSGTITGGSGTGNITIQVPNDMESYKAALEHFGESAGNHLSNITTATGDRSGGITDNLNLMNDRMRSTSDSLEQLIDILEQGTDKTSADIDALVAQARVLRSTITGLRDDLFRYEGLEIEDASDEAAGGDLENLGASPYEDEAYYDTSSFQQGKITLCINRGTVEADTNVGGIVGMVSTEYDFDPEDDITFTGAESFNIEQTVKAIVRESRNLGEIIGKKDYVGGIVGRGEYGAVISCESYGQVSSTGGSYVGGIAGSSSYAVRSCYVMGELSGKNYVGGITGKGCDIFYCYAYPDLEYTGENAGAIAGQVEDQGTLSGNYYVQSSIGGVDSIGYEGGAAPLTYEELCSHEGVPEAFSEFTVIFQADGVELASYQCRYGDSLTEDQIPEIPEKEGSYGVWPEYDFSFITGNRVLEAEYEKWVGSLASVETDENGRPRVLVQGEFLPDMELRLTEAGDGITVAVGRETENGSFEDYKGSVVVRALCGEDDSADSMKVEVMNGSGQYTEAASEVMGSYLEFAMEQPGTFRMKEEPGNGNVVIIAAVCGGAVVLLLLVLVIKKFFGKRKKNP